MSTRCQVIVKDKYSEVWFYRHSDGYPDGTMPSLNKFLGWVKEGRIRDNAEQASGWLVLIGHEEYLEFNASYEPNLYEPTIKGSFYGWKVGAYEPCSPVRHGDIKYLYTVDLDKKEISVQEVDGEFETGQSQVYD